ncbi:Berberine bridge enzyme-like 8 [Sesamum alatum]|uniref:Berberine bridge enzyme-like 8 n=1 Tax=Sesamum alatum TaxID=300844 RepID=A0AAE1XZL4_9LAMI|nr:Berberine bridge enzyme-like 8 [Sesamum alatum]
MKRSNLSMLPFFFFFLLLTDGILLTARATSCSPKVEHDFLECLNFHSEPSQPISQALYFPTNSSYSSVLQFYMRNRRFNESTIPKPQLILTALHVSHIQAAVVCAKSHGLEMRIRSGGHDFEGVSYVSNAPFFILDMFNLRAINVSVEDETAWVEAGATLGEVYYRIAEKSNIHGFPGGMCPTVGVGGQISGGGFGNLIRKYGLAADNVIDATLVDAVVASWIGVNGEDLFWAINRRRRLQLRGSSCVQNQAC